MKEIPAGLLDNIVNRLVRDLLPEKIILFGSHAYGNPSKDSDVDLLIVLKESSEPRYRRAQRAYRSLRGLTAPTELVVITQQELDKSSTTSSSFVRQAFRRGKVLYG